MTTINHQWRFIPAVEDVDRNSYGTIAYGIAITTLLLLFWPTRADAVSAGVLVMALGDGLAGLIGRNVDVPEVGSVWSDQIKRRHDDHGRCLRPGADRPGAMVGG